MYMDIWIHCHIAIQSLKLSRKNDGEPTDLEVSVQVSKTKPDKCFQYHPVYPSIIKSPSPGRELNFKLFSHQDPTCYSSHHIRAGN